MVVFLSALLIPFIFLVAGVITKIYPPKKINGTYGYRTKRSMANQKAWDFANIYSSNLCIRLGAIGMLLFGLIYAFMDTNETTWIILLFVDLFGTCIALGYFTEKKLKEQFMDVTNG